MDGNCGVNRIELIPPGNWEEDGPVEVDGEGVVPKKVGGGGEPPVNSCGSVCRLIGA
jgi:hypothetical protein